MRNVKESQWDIWESGDYVTDPPVTRAVIQKSYLKKYGPWRSLNFGQTEPWYELPNIKTVTVDQRLQSDAASCTITFFNQAQIDVSANLDLTHSGKTPGAAAGPSVRTLKDLAEPGFFSYRRGVTPSSAPRWGHGADPVWVDMLIPNRVIRTFQGYGTDGSLNPWNDANLTLTGTWLIDSVTSSTSGIITIKCRDAIKLMIEQRLYPPIIPLKQYPLDICADEIVTTIEEVEVEGAVRGTVGENVGEHIPSSVGWDSSVKPWYGYNASVYGHKASHAFDGDTSSYWLSVGNSGPNEVWSFEWIGAYTKGEPINQVHFKPKWGGYVCYVAVLEDGVWQGTSTVPYGYTSSPAWPNRSNKRYVKKINIPRSEDWFDIDLGRTYQAEQVWLIFTNLAFSGLGTYKYRAAVYEMQVRHVTPDVAATTELQDVETIVQGNIRDYTDIAKIFASWSGFYWPYGPSDQLHRDWEEDLINEGSDLLLSPAVQGRTWGDFAYSGAFPVEPVCIPDSFWDNKSVMDGVNLIKEVLGFICYADASGGLIWRMPNIWRTGNFITGIGYVGHDSVRDIDETKVLIDFGVTIDDQNLRSEIIVVAEDPTLIAAIKPGWSSDETVAVPDEGEVSQQDLIARALAKIPSAINPQGDLALLGGQERIMLVPNYPFISQDEVDKFAYLISLWIHWSYRKSKFRIPGNAAYEPDDQIRIFERISSEAYVHYLQGVQSVMDLDQGTWYLDVDTHWLGNGPDATWVVETYRDMPPALFAYLISIGQIDEDGNVADLPEGFDPDYKYPDLVIEYPRIEDDYNHLFPSLPVVNYPYNDGWSDQDIANDTSHPTTSPSPTGGGTVNHRSEDWRFAFWGSPASLDRVTIDFLYQFNTFWQANAPNFTHPDQLKTVTTNVPRAAVSAYQLMARQFAEEGYYVFSCTAFAGVNRKIAGTNRLSAHAWGLAIDINPNFSGIYNDCCNTSWSSWISRAHSQDFYDAIRDIVGRIRTKNSNVRVFGWGGYWTRKKDYMHIEVVATRSQLLEGVKLV